MTSSDQARLPHDAAGEGATRTAPRLVIRRGGSPLGALPLAAGVMGAFHAASALLELMPLAWELRVGALRGGVPSGARLELAWRSRVVPAGVITGGGAAAPSTANPDVNLG